MEAIEGRNVVGSPDEPEDIKVKKNKNIDMTNGTPWKLILSFTVPLLLGNLFQQAYNMVDSIVVGQFVGTEALAAVGGSMTMFMLLVSLFMGISTGASVVLSQYYGAKNFDKVRATAHTTVVLTIILSVVFMIVGYFVTPAMLRLINTPENVFADAVMYLRIIFLGIAACLFYNMLSGLLRGLGDSRSPLYILIISTIINIVLDLLFVLAFNMGVAGVAIATVIAQGISAVFAFFRMAQVSKHLKISLKALRMDKEIVGRIIRLGLPTGLQQVIISIGMMVIQSLINTFGSTVMATFNVTMRVDMLAVMPMMSFGLAVTTFVGQNIGAGKLDRVKKGTYAGFVMCAITGITLCIGLFFFGKYIMMMFTSDTEVLQYGVRMLQTLSFFYPFMGFTFLYSGVLRGAGDALQPMVNAILSNLLVRLPLSYLLVWLIGDWSGLYWSMAAGWMVAFAHILICYFAGTWKKKALMMHEEMKAMNGGVENAIEGT